MANIAREEGIYTVPPNASKTITQDQWLTTTIKWITSQSTLSREDADSVQIDS